MFFLCSLRMLLSPGMWQGWSYCKEALGEQCGKLLEKNLGLDGIPEIKDKRDIRYFPGKAAYKEWNQCKREMRVAVSKGKVAET